MRNKNLNGVASASCKGKGKCERFNGICWCSIPVRRSFKWKFKKRIQKNLVEFIIILKELEREILYFIEFNGREFPALRENNVLKLTEIPEIKCDRITIPKRILREIEKREDEFIERLSELIAQGKFKFRVRETGIYYKNPAVFLEDIDEKLKEKILFRAKQKVGIDPVCSPEISVVTLLDLRIGDEISLKDLYKRYHERQMEIMRITREFCNVQ